MRGKEDLVKLQRSSLFKLNKLNVQMILLYRAWNRQTYFRECFNLLLNTNSLLLKITFFFPAGLLLAI
jgi:hypothetical protein